MYGLWDPVEFVIVVSIWMHLHDAPTYTYHMDSYSTIQLIQYHTVSDSMIQIHGVNGVQYNPTSIPGWWFGTFGLLFHILGISSSQLTNSYCSGGVGQPPTRIYRIISWYPNLAILFPHVVHSFIQYHTVSHMLIFVICCSSLALSFQIPGVEDIGYCQGMNFIAGLGMASKTSLPSGKHPKKLWKNTMFNGDSHEFQRPCSVAMWN